MYAEANRGSHASQRQRHDGLKQNLRTSNKKRQHHIHITKLNIPKLPSCLKDCQSGPHTINPFRNQS